MKLIKQWRVQKDEITQADIAWLTGCCQKLDVKYEFKNLFDHQGRSVQARGNGQVFVDTVDDDQEAMLRLKYGGTGQLILMRVEHWDDRDIQQRVDYYEEDWNRTDEH